MIPSEIGLYTCPLLSCISVVFGIDCAVAKETGRARDREREEGNWLAVGEICVVYCVESVGAFRSLHHMSLPVFASDFCV